MFYRYCGGGILRCNLRTRAIAIARNTRSRNGQETAIEKWDMEHES
jgi:hypothetical protein